MNNSHITYSSVKMLSLARKVYIAGFLLLGIYYLKIGRYPVYDWLGLTSAAIIIVTYVLQLKLPRIDGFIFLSGAFLLLSAMATIPFVGKPNNSPATVLLYIYLIVVWIPIGSVVLTRWAHLRHAYSALVLSMAITSMYAIGQELFNWPILENVQYWGRMTGLTRHPNELGAFCAMVFPYALALVHTERSKITRMLWIAAIIVGVIGLFLSGSMTGIFALIGGMAVYFWHTAKIARLQAVGLTLICSISIAGASIAFGGNDSQSVVQRLKDFIQNESGRITLYSRLEADKYAWNGVIENPFIGHGYHAKAENVNTLIHNAFLGAWFNGGIFELLALLAILGGAILALLQARKWTRNEELTINRPYISAAGASFVAFLIIAMVSPSLYQRSSWFPVALLFAASTIVRRHRRRNACYSKSIIWLESKNRVI